MKEKLTYFDIVLRPLITEKSTSMGENRTYVFEVDKRVNKSKIKEAVEKIFNVKVEKVNVINVKPKPKRQGIYEGKSRSWKKAIVKLREGYTIQQLEGLH